MRRPHVYERSAPRRRRDGSPGADPGEAARQILRALPALIALAEAAVVPGLADRLRDARDEARRVEDAGRVPRLGDAAPPG